MTVLLIEDDPDDQLLFVEVINKLSATVQCHIASNGSEGLDLIDKMPRPDVIFLDINMPIMNGFEFLDVFRQIEIFETVPVYVLTTGSDDRLRSEAFRRGATEFLVKSSDFKSYCRLIEEILKPSPSDN